MSEPFPSDEHYSGDSRASVSFPSALRAVLYSGSAFSIHHPIEGKNIFQAVAQAPGKKPTFGAISTTPEGALENLEVALSGIQPKKEAGEISEIGGA